MKRIRTIVLLIMIALTFPMVISCAAQSADPASDDPSTDTSEELNPIESLSPAERRLYDPILFTISANWVNPQSVRLVDIRDRAGVLSTSADCVVIKVSGENRTLGIVDGWYKLGLITESDFSDPDSIFCELYGSYDGFLERCQLVPSTGDGIGYRLQEVSTSDLTEFSAVRGSDDIVTDINEALAYYWESQGI